MSELLPLTVAQTGKGCVACSQASTAKGVLFPLPMLGIFWIYHGPEVEVLK